MSNAAGVIRFVAALVGVAVLAGLAGCAARPIYTVNCGDDKPYKDDGGKTWLADQPLAKDADWGAVEGLTVIRDPAKIPGTPCPRVYLTERYSVTAYEFKLDPGTYTVRLHFAETYSGITAAGERVFDVSLGGKVVLKDLDVFKEAGGVNKPLVKELKGVAPSGGKLVIGFGKKVQNPEINGIEILAE